MSRPGTFTEKIRREVGYDPSDPEAIEALIAYTAILEGLVERINEMAYESAQNRASAADVCGMLFGEGLG